MAGYLEIIEIRDRALQGVTEPYKCLASDEFEYFVKGKSIAPQGSIKEWLSGKIAKAFGLPIPDFCAVKIDIELLRLSGDDALNCMGEGPAFASKKVHAADEFRYHAITKVDADLQRDLLVFDLWVRNDDRRLNHLGGNPNLLWAADKLHVIDHNNAFDETFDPTSFRQSHVFCNRLTEMNDIVVRQHYEEKMQSVLLGCWAEALDTMPYEWIEQNEDQNGMDQNQLYDQLLEDAQGNIWGRL